MEDCFWALWGGRQPSAPTVGIGKVRELHDVLSRAVARN